MGYCARLLPLLLAAPCYAQLIQLPPSPSSDLPTFKRQLIFYNLNRVVDQVKANNKDARQVDTLYKITKDATKTFKPSPIFTAKLGWQPQRGLIYSEIGLHPYIINTNLDIVNRQYSLRVQYESYSTTFSKPLNSNSYTIMLAKSFKIE